MDGEQRRIQLLEVLSNASVPTSGTYLSKTFEVSRQIIVQDIALLRAAGYDILATARGYILNKESATMHQRVVLVKHREDETEEELNMIIDNGGRVRNVIVSHPIYGQVVADLMLRTRRDIKQFVEKLAHTNASPLMQLTDGSHMHTVEAASKEELDFIEDELDKAGFLISSTR